MPVAFPEIGSGAPRQAEAVALAVPEIHRSDAGNTTGAAARLAPVPDQSQNGFDAAATADEILVSAREEAAKIIADAQASAAAFAELARTDARREMEELLAGEVEKQTAVIRGDLTRTIDEIAGLAESISRRHEKDIVELALQIARKVVGREVTIDREIAFTLVKISLAKLHNRAAAEVHLNPEDLAFVEMHRERLDFRGALDLVADRAISVGGCLIHTESGDIDGRIESQFEELAHGLFS